VANWKIFVVVVAQNLLQKHAHKSSSSSQKSLKGLSCIKIRGNTLKQRNKEYNTAVIWERERERKGQWDGIRTIRELVHLQNLTNE